jgi:enhanced disease susceptibility 1 protein
MGTVKLGENVEIKEVVIQKACSMAMNAHKSPGKQYLSKKIKTSSSEVVFSFPGSWSVNDWFTGISFGETKVDPQLFPSLKYVGLDVTATVNEVFLNRFKAVLANPQFQIEVSESTFWSFMLL